MPEQFSFVFFWLSGLFTISHLLIFLNVPLPDVSPESFSDKQCIVNNSSGKINPATFNQRKSDGLRPEPIALAQTDKLKSWHQFSSRCWQLNRNSFRTLFHPPTPSLVHLASRLGRCRSGLVVTSRNKWTQFPPTVGELLWPARRHADGTFATRQLTAFIISP